MFLDIYRTGYTKKIIIWTYMKLYGDKKCSVYYLGNFFPTCQKEISNTNFFILRKTKLSSFFDHPVNGLMY